MAFKSDITQAEIDANTARVEALKQQHANNISAAVGGGGGGGGC
jgi:hypothetical protein